MHTLILVTVLLAGVDETRERPNFVLCLADDQGWGDVGFRDHPRLQTPTLDAMATHGLSFERFYAAAPVCSPTRGSLLTGRHPNRFGCFAWGHWLRPTEITFAEALQEAGYATGHFGKWHLGPLDPGSPVTPGASGFETWSSAPNFFESNPRLSRNGTVVRTEGEGSKVVVDEALQFMQEAVQAQRSFVAVLWFASPHSPHQAGEADRAPHADRPEPEQHYLGELTAMDREVGRLREALREWQIEEQTLLWFTSDNGSNPPGSTGGLRGNKGTLFEGGLRVPSLVEWPGIIDAGRVIHGPAGTVDVLPTVLELAGVALPERALDGESLAAALRGAPWVRARPLGFWVYPAKGVVTWSERLLTAIEERQASQAPNPEQSFRSPAHDARRPDEAELPGGAAWIDGTRKLLRTPQEGGTFRYTLFDLARDPAESRDLAEEDPERVQEMAAALAAWQRHVLQSLREDS